MPPKSTQDANVPGSADALAAAALGRHPGTGQILRYFAWAHLPEAKDCFVRAAL